MPSSRKDFSGRLAVEASAVSRARHDPLFGIDTELIERQSSEPAADVQVPEPESSEEPPSDATSAGERADGEIAEDREPIRNADVDPPAEGVEPISETSEPQTGVAAPIALSARVDRAPKADQLVSVGTYLRPELEAALHLAAYERGGESEKSVIVREALDALLADLDVLPAESWATRMDDIRSDDDGGTARTPRVYLIEQTAKNRLALLAARDRVPMAAVIRHALGGAMARARDIEDEGAKE
jgi:hypothetical protein